MNFESLQLVSPILKAIHQCGYQQPTPIQAETIPRALAGRNLLASAQTGTGKTAAFVLPMLQRLSSSAHGRNKHVRALVLAPTRELAEQIAQAVRTYGKYLRLACITIFGGMPFREQIIALSKSPDIVIATPGRLLDHMDHGRIDLSHLEMFVLDEADRMLDMGFIDDVRRISAAVANPCQTMLFAATVGQATTRLAQNLLEDPERIQVAPEKITHAAIEQRLHLADSIQHKNRLLKKLCADSSMTKAIIFSATKSGADSLAHSLTQHGYPAAALHGDMTQNARNRTVLRMRNGKIRLLVATDVAARGLDVAGISHVINFDLPRFAEDYVHRIGRTGRAGQSGIAISFALHSDFPYLDRIERYTGHNLSVQTIPGLEPTTQLRASTSRQKSAGKFPAVGTNNPGKRGRRAVHSFARKQAEDNMLFSGIRKRGTSTRKVAVEQRNLDPHPTNQSKNSKIRRRKPSNPR
ncbi:DEAD/DEAH box helicase [Desulfoferrobacter suflitae]|uniref:DEAD/DEAH box helicase n=1 Tax=Desulfoferrobacter suflitae TaxID=2865782 RepID=UPI002164A52A|nr:DEAD/DEAH box helicase [Desulfoferrobacter suflitae]MCK8601554.1 DEAD/DEAH box helicase [Desulfoferrobacter suflitae]